MLGERSGSRAELDFRAYAWRDLEGCIRTFKGFSQHAGRRAHSLRQDGAPMQSAQACVTQTKALGHQSECLCVGAFTGLEVIQCDTAHLNLQQTRHVSRMFHALKAAAAIASGLHGTSSLTCAHATKHQTQCHFENPDGTRLPSSKFCMPRHQHSICVLLRHCYSASFLSNLVCHRPWFACSSSPAKTVCMQVRAACKIA